MSVAAPALAPELTGRLSSVVAQLRAARVAQQLWATVSLGQRLGVVRQFRHLLASEADCLPPLISSQLSRTQADTISSEILPLAEAARFLELEAKEVLCSAELSDRSRPLWLRGVKLHVQRDPWGVVLVIGPSNYPLFLPAVQALQALVAGNAVFWKPGRGGEPIASAVSELLSRAGVPDGLITVTDESANMAQELIALGVDKIVMTGSEASGRSVLHAAAEHLTPATVELSGCDAMCVLSDADVSRSVAALLFGLRLNGSGTCIAPRRVFVHASLMERFRTELLAKLDSVPAARVEARTAALLDHLTYDAVSKGAMLLTKHPSLAGGCGPIVLDHARPDMQVMQTDVFAPIVGLCSFADEQEALVMVSQCRFALGATVFGSEQRALAFARQLQCGIVVVNDMIAPTADPRISFGGRRGSGFGKSRGAEGLLEMTVSKTVVLQTARRLRHLETPHPQARELFSGFMKGVHGRGFAFKARSLFALRKTLARKSES